MFASKQIYNEYIVNSSRKIVTDEKITVFEWVTVDNKIHGVGYDKNVQLASFELTTKVGFLVITDNVSLLTDVFNLAKIEPCKYETWESTELTTNSLTLIDKLNGETELTNHMYYILTENFAQTKRLQRVIENNVLLAKRIKIFGEWSIELMVNMIKYKTTQKLSNIFNVCMNKYFEKNESCCTLPIVSFDIETVSKNVSRVPFGNHISDVLFSVVFVTSTGERIDCWNVPPNYKHAFPNHVNVFHDEEVMLEFVLEYLINFPSVFICTGYNIVNYDLAFLVKRAIYLNMSKYFKHFHLNQNILTIGKNMIVVDLYDIMSKFFRDTIKQNMKLKTILKTFLTDLEKFELNAVKLRFVYQDMLTQYFLNNNQPALIWPEHDITLVDAITYNYVDSYGVYRVWVKLGLEKFIKQGSQYMNSSFIRFAVSKSKEYLSTNHLLKCLNEKIMWCVYKPKRISAKNNTYITYDLKQLSSADFNDTSRFGGGFNYKSGYNFCKNVSMMDMVAYYPYIIEGFNLSHENCMVFTKNLLVKYSKKLFTPSFVIYKFCTHKLLEKQGLQAISKLFVDDLLDNVEQIHNENDLDLYDLNDRFIVINCNDGEGVLPKVIRAQNVTRNKIKQLCKDIERTKKLVKKQLDKNKKPTSKQVEQFSFIVNTKAEMFDCSVRIKREWEKLNLEALAQYLTTLEGEYERLFALYRTLKLVNNSYYGFLGSDFGCLQGQHVASIVTTFGRKYIITSATLGEKHGFKCVLMDTDSIFLHGNQNPLPIQQGLLAINPKLELNDKNYDDLLVIAKKTYFATTPKGTISKGINANGPQLWQFFMYKIYNEHVRSSKILSANDIMDILKGIFQQTYDMIKTDKTLVLCTSSCKQLQDYKVNTPMKRLLLRYKTEQNSETNPNKLVYWHFHDASVEQITWKFEHELENCHLADINLFKFYQEKCIKPFYKLLNWKIIESCQKNGYNFYLNEKLFKNMVITAYLEVRQKNTMII